MNSPLLWPVGVNISEAKGLSGPCQSSFALSPTHHPSQFTQLNLK